LCVGVRQHDRVKIITSDVGNRTIPSNVAFTRNYPPPTLLNFVAPFLFS
jgi:molecular chaperone DnaK (HSP70)